MSTGLIALLDDIAALGKMAAASLDDVAGLAGKAGSKAAGIVIDDAAVTPRYVVGLAAERELPIIGKIAAGSLKNKLLFLLPGALGLSYFAPWLITPLLMVGGAYLCLEGYHKVADLVGPGKHAKEEEAVPESAMALPQSAMALPQSASAMEDARVASAIRTDFILSAEILAITLGSLPKSSLWMQGLILVVVSLGMTGLVYGVVALIVKADDVGLAMAQSSRGWLRGLGRGLVQGMPYFLQGLSLLGMLAMLWVGGGILVHGLAQVGQSSLEKAVHEAALAAGEQLPDAKGMIVWVVEAGISGLLGLGVGGVCDLVLRLFDRGAHQTP
jgi:uncharacterized protein